MQRKGIPVNTDIITEIQRRSGGPTDYGFVSSLERDEEGKGGAFYDYAYLQGEGPQHITDSLEIGWFCLFFTPLVYSISQRSNDTVSSPGVLFADLDGADDPEIKPSVMWETSPGNRQAVWFLQEQMSDYDEWADLNRRMTYYIGADRGGWMGSKLLRIPGTHNWKRNEPGRLLWAGGPEYSVEYMDDNIPTIFGRRKNAGRTDHPSIPSVSTSNATIRALWFTLGLRGQHMLMKKQVGDRSLWIVRTAHELVKNGITQEDTFTMLWGRPWNKWATDRWDPEHLWAEITAIAAE